MGKKYPRGPDISRELLGAFKRGHRRGVQEYIDDDLAYQLLAKANRGCAESRKALEWIAKFNNEFYKCVIKKDDPSALNKDHYREIVNDNNARRRDLLSALHSKQIRGTVIPCGDPSFDFEVTKGRSLTRHEDAVIDLISPKAQKKLSKSYHLPHRPSKKGAIRISDANTKEHLEMSEEKAPMPSVPKDLEAQLHTIGAYAQIFAIMHKATFPPTVFQAAHDSIEFIKRVHEAAVETALKHKHAELVPELAEVLKKMKESKDGAPQKDGH